MRYYEVFVGDNRYRGDAPLTYSYKDKLAAGTVVTVPLQNRLVTGFLIREVDEPSFNTKPIKAVLSDSPLPSHCIELAGWMADYYQVSLGESLRQFTPSQPAVRSVKIMTRYCNKRIGTSLNDTAIPDADNSFRVPNQSGIVRDHNYRPSLHP